MNETTRLGGYYTIENIGYKNLIKKWPLSTKIVEEVLGVYPSSILLLAIKVFDISGRSDLFFGNVLDVYEDHVQQILDNTGMTIEDYITYLKLYDV